MELLRTVLQDARYALRQWWRNPSFAAVVLATLALGIGGVSAIGSLVDAVLLRPLPYQEPARLVLLWEHDLPRANDHNVIGPYNFLRWRERSKSFADLAGFMRWEYNVFAAGQPERLPAGIATGNLFSVLGVRALLGRALCEDDSKPGAPDVVVISEDYWRRRFGADEAVLGRSLEVNGASDTIVGVMPRSVQIPPDVALWVPVTMSESFGKAGGRWMTGIGRLKDGVALAQARDEMKRIAAQLQMENPEFDAGWSVNVEPLHADLVRELRPAVLVLLGAVALVMLIACVNVANLLLSRALAREREVALRSALGASRGRLLRQLLTEAALAACVGGALGLLLGRYLLAGIVLLLPPAIPLVVSLGLDARVVLFTAATVVSSVVLFGLAPALQLARRDLLDGLRHGGAVRGASGSRRALKNGLVVAEVAFSALLLVGCGLLLRSFWRLAGVDPGFRAEQVLTAELSLPYREKARIVRFYDDLLARLRSVAGVQHAGAISWTPLGNGSATDFRALDRPKPAPGQEPVADVRIVTPGTFAALGMPLRLGRDFAEADGASAPNVVLVNETAARELWPGRSALGQRIAMSWGDELVAEVIGVVGDVRLSSLSTRPRATLYWCQAQLPNSFMTLVVRGGTEPVALGAVLRSTVAQLDGKLPVGRIQALSDVVDASLASQRFLLVLTAAFASVALLLAGIGIYGVLSYEVARRIPEMGVRLALGARPADVARLVMAGALRLSALGALIGLLAAAAASRLLRSLLFEVAPWDPVTYAGVVVLGLALVLLVAALPARRAASLEPAIALREE